MSTSWSATITYYDPFGIAPHIIKDIQSRLPLRNLQWDNPPRPLRSIASLEVNLQEESLGDDAVPKHQIPGLSDSPYMKLILVKCEDNDTYRNSVRGIIREWFSTKVASKRDSTEWLIMYFEPIGTTSGSNTALRFKTGGFDKTKSDFNSSAKEDRCILVKAAQTAQGKIGPYTIEDTEFWNEVMSKVKDGVLNAFGRRVRMYEEEVRKLEAKRNIPGWNFATFFVMKEGLALSFESLSLLEDALMQYDELDATFMQLMRSNNADFFQNIGFNIKTAGKLLSEDRDNEMLRHQILQNHITLFDFRCYLFSKQASILLLLLSSANSPSMTAVRVADFLVRTRNFTLETSKMLISYGKNSYFVANWVFGLVQEVMDATQVQPAVIQGGHTRDVAEGRADLLLLSRSSIEQLAAWKGWRIGDGGLEDTDLLSEVEMTAEDEVTFDEYMNPRLKELLSSEEKFVTAYLEMTEIVRSLYESADRTRSVDKLRAQMAIIKYKQKEYEQTVRLLASLPQLYSSQGWETISTNLFMIYADCLEHLGRTDECVKIYLQALANRDQSSIFQFSDICTKINALCNSLTTEFTFALPALFSTSVSKTISVSDDEDDSFYISLEVTNPFAVAWTLHGVSIRTIEPDGMKHTVIFQSGKDVLLQPGVTVIKLRTTHSIPGVYEIDSIEFRIGKLVLIKDYFGEQPIENQTMLMYQQPGNMDVKLSTPSCMKLEDQKLVIVEIHTGWNEVQEAKITARSASTGLKLAVPQTTGTLVSSDNTEVPIAVESMAGSSSQLTFGAAGKNSVVCLSMPITFSSGSKELYIRVQVEFKAGNDEYYSVAVVRHVSITLSLVVNVQDIFKVSSLFSRFSVSCIGQSTPLRIVSGSLIGTDEFDVAGGKGGQRSYVAFPKQPVVYSFRITRSGNGKLRTQPEPLTLVIRYRRLEDEVRQSVSRIVQEKLAATQAAKYALLIAEYMQSVMTCDLNAYGFLGKLQVGEYDAAEWSSVLGQIENGDRVIIETTLKEIYEYTPRKEEDFLHQFTKELVIPVAIPSVQVLFSVELDYLRDSESDSDQFGDRVFYIGQPITVRMKLRCTNAWTPAGDDKKDVFKMGDVEFAYEVSASSDTWIISGKRKGHFIVSEDVVECALTMLPVRHGNLLLPRIDVKPSQQEQRDQVVTAEVEYKNLAESILVLPEVSNVVLAVGE
ncbi:trafficking protein particle complex subunit 10 [Lipomyces arxii]|uniref:trafficking protein particle complex subunit 10 n=1 Tax=Lipomyces arxii TaxID=56418 RepID=UPI0034CE357E